MAQLTKSEVSRPSDDMVVIAMLLHGPRWLYADEVRGTLRRLGWVVSSQGVAATLRRLSKEDTPMVTGRELWGANGLHEWAATCWGKNQIEAHFPGMQRWEIVADQLPKAPQSK